MKNKNNNLFSSNIERNDSFFSNNHQEIDFYLCKKRNVVRNVTIFFILFFVIFVIWGVWAPIDDGVSMSAMVNVFGETQDIASFENGVVGKLLVSDGQHVMVGEPLVVLNMTEATSQDEELRKQISMLEAEQIRLIAEQNNLSPVIPKNTLASPQDISYQLSLMKSLQIGLISQLTVLKAQLPGNRMVLNSTKLSIMAYKEQLASLIDQRNDISTLVKQGYVSENKLRQADQQINQVESEIYESLSQAGKAKAVLEQIENKIKSIRDEFSKNIKVDFLNNRNKLDQLFQQLKGADFILSQQVVRSPVNGIVYDLNIHTIGGIIQSGETLMRIVPSNRPMQIIGNLRAQDIGVIKVGQPVFLAFTTFDRATTPRIKGKIIVVSASRLNQKSSNVPYYKVYIEISANQIKKLGAVSLRSGMPVQAFVHTGTRSFMSYMFQPLIDRIHNSWSD